jgi:aspartate 1-decarboxylase
MFRSKIHRATVTHADLHYEGSISIDAALLEAAQMLPYEQVHVWNVTLGTRLTTYALEAPRNSGIICLNGAAAHLNRPGDLIIAATFATMNEEEARVHRPVVVRVDEKNRLIALNEETPGPALPLFAAG